MAAESIPYSSLEAAMATHEAERDRLQSELLRLLAAGEVDAHGDEVSHVDA